MTIKSIYVSGDTQEIPHFRAVLENLGYHDILFSCLEDYANKSFEENMKRKISCLMDYNEIAFLENWREFKSSILEYDLAKRLKIPMKFFKGDTLEDKPLQGIKFDSEKLDWSLIDLKNLEGMIRVLQYGALKYDHSNWKFVSEAKERYYKALMRHLIDYREGKPYDEETGCSPIDAVLVNAYFLKYFEEQEKKQNEQT